MIEERCSSRQARERAKRSIGAETILHNGEMVAPGIHALSRHLHIPVQWPSWLTKSPGAILNIA